jgi:membrane protease YdiL (CAAX protease family)
LQLKDVGVMPNKGSISRVVMGFIVGLLLPSLLAASTILRGHVQFVLSQEVTLSAVLSTFLLYLIASCREELAFRAFPLRTLNYTFGPWPALLIIALIFGIEHVIGGSSWLNGLVGAGVGSLLYGIAALKTKGLAFPIGIHAAWNFGQWMLGMKGEPGVWKVVIEQGYKSRVDTIGFICYLLVMGLGIVAVHLYWRKSPSKELGIMSEKRDDHYAFPSKEGKHSTQHQL